jgi:YidC/Oxa1 family membrane protein insertase
MTDQKNLILAIVFSVGIILLFQVFYEMPRLREQERLQQLQEASQTEQDGVVRPAPSAEGLAPGSAEIGDVLDPGGSTASRDAALEQAPRVAIDNGRVHGSIALKGGRIDDITLVDYRQYLGPDAPEVELLNPSGTPAPYFAEFGWVGTNGVTVPDAETVWQTTGERLTATEPVDFRWDNGEGLTFTKRISVDSDFMFTVERSVENTSGEPVTLYPYGLLTRWPTPDIMGFFILHEGPIGVLGGTLKEIDYADLRDGEAQRFDSDGGWVGFTDKYWLASLVPDQAETIEATFRHTLRGSENRYQIDYLGQGRVIAPGETATVTDRLFAGAKEVSLLDAYSERYGIPLFDRAVDFGWFYFLTKPIFHVLTWLYALLGNYGLAILALTLIVKLLFYPLANKSYRSMSQMKKLQPEMVKLRERYENDKQKMQQELMALYKREKVNPMAGCLPILVQIPVFFALYKVLFVSIEMRHAPFFGWIQDLSAPDPTSIFNLFGLLPFGVPAFLMIGVWPILMGITMFLQFKLNPQPADPIQAKVMMFLPLIFVFLFATFPAGLVIYWTWNNILSIGQQWLIMKRMGVKAG